ncbi:MAG: hypothetical protein ACFFBD_25645 [Candidatus Hodarchaeota archaeon]
MKGKKRKLGYLKRIKDALQKFLAIRKNQVAVLISAGIILASFIPLFQGDVFFVLALFGITGEVVIGTIYLIWNVGSLALLFLVESEELQSMEKVWVKWMIKRNLFVAAIWILATVGLMIIFPNPRQGPLFLFGVEITVLMFIGFYTTVEESPFLESTTAFERLSSDKKTDASD